MLAGPLVEELHNLRAEEKKPSGLCYWVQDGFLFPAMSEGAAGRRGTGFTLTEVVGKVCLEMLRKFTACSWGRTALQDALQRCGHFAGSCGHSHLAKSPLCWGRHFSALPPALWTCRCLSIDSGAHRVAGDRVVAHGVSCDLYALNAACLGGLGAPQACISRGLPPPAAQQCWDQHFRAANASEPAQTCASRHASLLLPSAELQSSLLPPNISGRAVSASPVWHLGKPGSTDGVQKRQRGCCSLCSPKLPRAGGMGRAAQPHGHIRASS